MTVSDATPGEGPDPGALFERLRAADVLDENEDGAVVITAEFDDERDLYDQTYGDLDDERFVEAVAAAFGIDEATAAERIETHGVTREEFVAYMALQSYLDDPPPTEQLAVMAGMVADVGVASPVPDGMRELADDTYEAFVAESSDAAVFVWRHRCDPCERLKEDLPELRTALPDDVAVAGVDGDAVPDLRQTFEVESAPTLLLFRDGELVESVVGRYPVERYRETFADIY